jgi:thiol-disulfide isomerase/thioredoxin
MRHMRQTMKRFLPAGLFAIVYRPRRGMNAPVAAAVGVLLTCMLCVTGSVMPLFAADPLLPAFGGGAVEVRVYTDYFCGPCRAEEREVIASITELVEKNRIRVIFIDTPLYPDTVLYAGYFLAALNVKREFGQAVAARSALFEAAGLQISGKGELEGFLAKKGLEFRPFDTTPVFAQFSKYIKEDRINSTPTIVIINPQGKQILGGKEQILKALGDLRK